MSIVSKVSRSRTSSPALSVVLASVNGWELLRPTLEALDAQPERPDMEILVVDRVGGATREAIRAHQPPVELIEVDEPLAIPQLRHRGVRLARGGLVAILEDHGSVEPGWAASLIEAHQGPWGAVAGPVENGRGGWVNAAAFLCEYAPYMRPLPEGEWIDLPGNNIAYKRPHLMRHASVLESGKWESWINERLRVDGVPLATTNGAVVRHIKPFRLREFLVQRFHFARSFAGMRRVDQSWPKRLIYALGSTLLPAILTLRLTRTVLAKRRPPAGFLACLPLIVLFFAVGAAGEMLGYLAGSGDSLERVE